MSGLNSPWTTLCLLAGRRLRPFLPRLGQAVRVAGLQRRRGRPQRQDVRGVLPQTGEERGGEWDLQRLLLLLFLLLPGRRQPPGSELEPAPGERITAQSGGAGPGEGQGRQPDAVTQETRETETGAADQM